MLWFTAEQVGRTQSLTPEGFLLCEAVPVARVGEMFYAAGEVPVEAGRDGLIRITRDEGEVFRPETVASAVGKPVTDDHPPEAVTPANWRAYALGTAHNPRRGTGMESDMLFCDLLITDASAIQAVRQGKRQISAGYDADYEQIEPGRGRQSALVFNHFALVDAARCGPRCSIGDKEMTVAAAAAAAAARPRRTVWDRIVTAFKAGDQAALDEALDDARKAKEEEEEGGGKDAGGGKNERAHVVVHVHNRPDDTGDAGAAAAGDDTAAGADGGDSAAGAEGGDPVQQIATAVEALTQRMAAIEDVVRELAGASGEGEEEAAAEGEGEAEEEEEEERQTEDAAEGMAGEVEGEPGSTRTEAAAGGTVPGPAPRAASGDPGPAPTTAGQKRDATDMTMDSDKRRRLWTEVNSRSEILSPGIKLMTFDAALKPQAEAEALCKFRKRALDAACKDDGKREIIEGLTGGAEIGKLTCDTARVVFIAASNAVRERNNGSSRVASGGGSGSGAKPRSIADINKRNREFYRVT